ncbi:glycosyltransferase family 1 protein [Altererythrobacter sp. ZODW24]|uniref:glycosyltransferase family 4 protein n=1 Tax=Altererythrobacter sp. ZODW24 TaxID=2185142 RepID=UPI000DF79409|nr:glycosyltransferase family 1 protein [Altererythrobacter sp. ZODW24]
MLRVTHFLRHPRPHLFSMERLYAAVRGALPQDIEARVWSCEHPSKGVLPRLRDAMAAWKEQGAVNHVTGDAHYLTFFLGASRTVLTVHDTESLERSSGIKRFLLWLFWFRLPVWRSAKIVVISEATRAALHRVISVDDGKLVTIPNPLTSQMDRKSQPFNAVRPRILHVGTKANKNLDRHVAALAGLDIELVILGRMTARQHEVLDGSGLEWSNPADLDEAELAGLYAGCDLLLFASTVEGFGLPILEAQSAGIPVITSNCSSMPEVAGDGAILVDPSSEQDIRSAVMKVIEEPDLRAQLVRDGDINVSRYSPEHIAGLYAELYRRVAASS